MRIISGRCGGRTITPPKNLRARPTTDFAKENLFNVLGNLIDFEDIEVCEFLANIEIYDHKQYKKRCSKGLTLRMDRLDRVKKGAKRRNRMRAFFAKIFKRKKSSGK